MKILPQIGEGFSLSFWPLFGRKSDFLLLNSDFRVLHSRKFAKVQSRKSLAKVEPLRLYDYNAFTSTQLLVIQRQV